MLPVFMAVLRVTVAATPVPIKLVKPIAMPRPPALYRMRDMASGSESTSRIFSLSMTTFSGSTPCFSAISSRKNSAKEIPASSVAPAPPIAPVKNAAGTVIAEAGPPIKPKGAEEIPTVKAPLATSLFAIIDTEETNSSPSGGGLFITALTKPPHPPPSSWYMRWKSRISSEGPYSSSTA